MEIQTWNELSSAFASLCTKLSAMLAVEKEKTAALETGDIGKLNDLINAQQALVMDCSAAEARRQALCSGLGVSTVSELCQRYPEASEHIGGLHDELRATVAAIKKTDALNTKLLDTRLNVIKIMTSQLGTPSRGITYGRNAASSAGGAGSLTGRGKEADYNI